MPAQAPPPVAVPERAAPEAAAKAGPAVTGIKDNNYSRPSGQNVGNFITDKPSSRVLAPPGELLLLYSPYSNPVLLYMSVSMRLNYCLRIVPAWTLSPALFAGGGSALRLG